MEKKKKRRKKKTVAYAIKHHDDLSKTTVQVSKHTISTTIKNNYINFAYQSDPLTTSFSFSSLIFRPAEVEIITYERKKIEKNTLPS